jgi:TPR repeat protein
VPKNENQGLELQKRAFQGLNNMSGNPYAITALGVMLFQGKVVPENKKEAARLYKIAADMGFAPAQFNYSACLMAGQGVQKNPEAAQAYWRAAFNQSYPPAMSGPPQ